jgi:hypothetical protein
MKIDLNIKNHRKWFSVIVNVVIALLLTLWGIYGIEQYGIFLFFLIPFFIGAGSALLYGHKNEISFSEARNVGFLALFIYSVALIIFAIEGLICIAMAAPLGFLFTWIGSIVGHLVLTGRNKNASLPFLILIICLPTCSFLEKDSQPHLTSVVSSIEINASAKTVWENVIRFPKLKEPSEFIFKTGIAYPIDAIIDGEGIGAIRYCNFTTGSFVEPIIIWHQPHILKFSVKQQPAPLKEISFWDIDAPHLHDYFVSTEGQFKLTTLKNGNTLLEGTTWYYNDIKPEIYWSFWSKYIVHKIHYRVLDHIKTNSENKRNITSGNPKR